MKESKFIELLNLYIDQEISREDAAALEAEILRAPERRKVYQQYCRMARASGLLFERFHAQSAPTTGKLVAAARQADEKVVAFPGGIAARRHVAGWYMAAGLTAVAACVGFVLMRPVAPAGALAEVKPAVVPAVTVAVSQPVSMPQAAVAPASVAVPPQRLGGEFQPVFAAFTKEARPPLLASGNVNSYNWIQEVKITPMRLTPDRVFTPASGPTALPVETVGERSAEPNQVETTAFQFQR